MTVGPSNRTIVLHLLRGAVPERADALCRLWMDHGHDVEVAPSAPGATMNATRRRIRFDTKTIDFFWLMGFATWRALELYGPAVALATGSGATVDQILDADDVRAQLESDYRQRMAATEALLAADATDAIVWPEDIPKPTDERASLPSQEHVAVFDLVCLALAFVLLHELRHVMFRKAGDGPEARYEEEMACDIWARTAMTSHLAEYARNHGHTFAEVEQKRAPGIVLAAIIVHAMTPPTLRWENDEYPPIADRLTGMIVGYQLPDDANFWFFTACLLVATMRRERRPLDIAASSYRELVEMLIERLR